jgi:lipopolysaccharide export LptBFGC system permease protein LptF
MERVRLRLRILDRFMLRATAPALAAAILVLVALWFLEGPIPASTGGTYALAVALAVVFGRLARSGEFGGLLQAGVSPRRSVASVVAIAAAFAVLAAAAACTLRPPSVRTEYAGYVLAALQLPLAASLALPLAVRSRREEPWARMILMLLGYTVAIVAVTAEGRTIGWPPGAEWLFIDAALLATDIALYRDLVAPRRAP